MSNRKCHEFEDKFDTVRFVSHVIGIKLEKYEMIRWISLNMNLSLRVLDYVHWSVADGQKTLNYSHQLSSEKMFTTLKFFFFKMLVIQKKSLCFWELNTVINHFAHKSAYLYFKRSSPTKSKSWMWSCQPRWIVKIQEWISTICVHENRPWF